MLLVGVSVGVRIIVAFGRLLGNCGMKLDTEELGD